MQNRNLILILAAVLLVAAAAFGYTLTRGSGEKEEEPREQVAEKSTPEDRTACASNATYARLKEVAFEEAVRLRNSDPANLDTLAASSVVRMENPVVMSRDEELNVTVCSGRFILELPPGAESAFNGQRRLSADIEYSAQAAADRSGLVYEIRGAEPIIQQLAAFNLQGQNFPPAQGQAPGETQFAEAATPPTPPEADGEDADRAEADAPAQAPRPTPAPPAPRTTPSPKATPKTTPRPTAQPAPTPERRAATARPSFNCRYARSRSEQMVCSNERLAAKDRAMSSLFYSALADADGRTRRELRRTRDRFLAYRERCGSASCVAEAYDGRMQEIRDIMAEMQ